MPKLPEPTVLQERAHAYLDDARNPSISLHTRYSAAFSALACLCHTGLATAEDWKRVEKWKSVRYDPVAAPTADDLETTVQRVEELIARAIHSPRHRD